MTTKQRLFCDNYISNGFNAAKAARDAGYAEKNADVIGNQNLGKLELSNYINKRIRELLSDVDRAAYDIIRELDEIRNADIGNYVQIVTEKAKNKTGEDVEVQRVIFKPTADLNTKVISEISETQSGGIRIKMYDRLKAIELKGRYLSLWSDTLNVVKEARSPEEELSKEERRKRIIELSSKLKK